MASPQRHFLLFLFVAGALLLVGADDPCEDDTTAVPPTTIIPNTTTLPKTVPTTTSNGCEGGMANFKRKKGWWCTIGFFLTGRDNVTPIPLNKALFACMANKAVLSSFETDEELLFWRREAGLQNYTVVGMWMGIGYNNVTKQYFKNDGHTDNPTLPQQPVPLVPGGVPAWRWDLNATSAPYGYPVLVDPSGLNSTFGSGGTSMVNMFVCGFPGLQFD